MAAGPRCSERFGRGELVLFRMVDPQVNLPKGNPMKGLIAWFMGVPIVVIVILYVLGVF